MHFLDIANKIIPGYSTLSMHQRETFEQSEVGTHFTALINNTELALENLNASNSWWNFFTGKTAQKKQEIQEDFEQKKKILIQTVQHQYEYKEVLGAITWQYLKANYPDFQLLSRKQKKKLASAGLTQQLFVELNKLDEAIQDKLDLFESLDSWGQQNYVGQEYKRQIKILVKQRNTLFINWEKELAADPEMHKLLKNIERKKEIQNQGQLKDRINLLNTHLRQLGEFLPLLHHRLTDIQPTFYKKILDAYFPDPTTLPEDPEKLDKEQLSNMFFSCMQQVNQIEVKFINLDDFNRKQANKMAAEVLKAFNTQNELAFDEWFNQYQIKLNSYLQKQAQLIHGKAWEPSIHYEDIINSLSCLWKNKAIDKANEFMGRLADAHAFIQYTSASTQNESSILAILDLYNYGRYNTQISETKAIITSLLKPLLPLYNEYKDIAFYEKNPYWKVFRILMPIVITVGTIVAVSSIVAPLALPELAFLAVFIPSLILGIALATKYVSVKNQAYKAVRDTYYGGPFEIPEFQINERMTTAFGSTEQALKVRKFYTEALKECDEIEARYQIKHVRGILKNDKEIALRKANVDKRHHLCLEWYDIHSNKDLGFEDLPKLVLNRLSLASDKEYAQLLSDLQREASSIESSAARVAQHLKKTIVNNNQPVEQTPPSSDLIKTKYLPGFFRTPRAFEHKLHVEEMASLAEGIVAQCA